MFRLCDSNYLMMSYNKILIEVSEKISKFRTMVLMRDICSIPISLVQPSEMYKQYFQKVHVVYLNVVKQLYCIEHSFSDIVSGDKERETEMRERESKREKENELFYYIFWTTHFCFLKNMIHCFILRIYFNRII